MVSSRVAGLQFDVSAAVTRFTRVVTTRSPEVSELLVKKWFDRRSAAISFLVVSLVLAACGTGLADGNWPAATADGDVVYVAYGLGVVAIDVVVEELLWSFPSEASPGLQFYAAPSVDDDQVVFGDYGRTGGFFSPGVTVSVYRVDNRTAPSTVWVQSGAAKDRIIAPALQADGKVFIGTADNHVLALDADTGRVLWHFDTRHSVWGQPTYDDGVLYVTSLDKEVYALAAESGENLWRQELDGAIPGMATHDTDVVYVGSFDKKVSALDKTTGEVRWTAPAAAAVWASPVLHEDSVYYVDMEGNVYSVSAVSGEGNWSVSLASFVTATPLVIADAVFVATAGDPSIDAQSRLGALVALAVEDGAQRWRQTTEAPVNSGPVETSRGVAVVSPTTAGTFVLKVYNVESGSERYRFELPAR
jgi:outer membrane protein assembly factor BamB